MSYVRGIPRPDSTPAGKTSWVLLPTILPSVPNIKAVLSKYLLNGKINKWMKTRKGEHIIGV